RAMNMAPFIFWNLAFYTIIRTQLASLMKKGIELEKKYPIPDQMDEIDTDKYISSIPEYKKF
ncbi:hypothetical protein ABNB86_13945, partial [Paenibacillus larvae]